MNEITTSNYEEHQSRFRAQFKEFAQKKSDFQIEKFVACSESTIPVQQYRHVLAQMRIALTELKRRIIDRERHIRARDRANVDHHEDWDLDVAIAETEIESLTYDIDSKLVEVNQYATIMKRLEDEHGSPFTNVEFQESEPEYWRRRLARQLHDSVVDRQTGCGQGNLVALREACAEPILPDSPNQLEMLPIELHALDQITKGTELVVPEKIGTKQIAPDKIGTNHG